MGYCAWMADSEFYVDTENAACVMLKMEKHGYAVEFDDEGNIIGVDFSGEKLSYDEDEMFQQIAPFVKSGSYIEMHDEDSEQNGSFPYNYS